ncbi:hypothetical protein MPSEU_001068100 [Mayamaea pseudoterrestris]|nr:hypothetical protein MPSEU_001068100 [Mayamaea pseudoterrestris]
MSDKQDNIKTTRLKSSHKKARAPPTAKSNLPSWCAFLALSREAYPDLEATEAMDDGFFASSIDKKLEQESTNKPFASEGTFTKQTRCFWVVTVAILVILVVVIVLPVALICGGKSANENMLSEMSEAVNVSSPTATAFAPVSILQDEAVSTIWSVIYKVSWEATMNGCMGPTPVATVSCSDGSYIDSTDCIPIDPSSSNSTATCATSPSTFSCRGYNNESLGVKVQLPSQNYSCFKQLNYLQKPMADSGVYKGGSTILDVYLDILVASGGSTNLPSTSADYLCNQHALVKGCSVSNSCRLNVNDRDIRSDGDGGYDVIYGSEGCLATLADTELILPDNAASKVATNVD